MGDSLNLLRIPVAFSWLNVRAGTGSHPWRVWECHQALLEPPNVGFTSIGVR